MGFRSSLEFACPACGQDKIFLIQCDPAWSKLTASNPFDPWDIQWDDYGGHEWSETNLAQCGVCQWRGRVGDLSVPAAGEAL